MLLLPLARPDPNVRLSLICINVLYKLQGLNFDLYLTFTSVYEQ